MNKQKGAVGIIVLVILVLALSGTAYYFYQQNNGETVTNIYTVDDTHVTKENGATTSSTHIKITTPVTTTTSCGSQDCFGKKFAACEPTTFTAETPFASVSDKIIGPATGGCQVTFRFTKNPNPDWENKDMTCVFNNTIDWETSFNKTFADVVAKKTVCSGPLYTILTSVGN